MKRLIGLFSILLIALTLGCGGGGGGSSGGGGTTAKTTFLVYMVGSDLENNGDPEGGAATGDIIEMAQVGSTANVNVIIETGGADVTNQIDWKTVQRHKVIKDDIETISNLGSVSMGDPNTLKDFITWGVATYPADKYHLILWNHGGGTGGFGWDEVHGNDNLELSEIDQALSQAETITGVTFETFGFDACLMATIEVASLASPYAKYFVASEESEPGHGWDYTPILTALKTNPAIAGNSLGKVIADSYKAQADATAAQYRAAGEAYNQEKEITLSVMDLSKIADVSTAWESLMAVATPSTQLEYYTFGKAVESTKQFGVSKDPGNPSQGLADLSDMSSKLSADYPTEANAVNTAVSQAVIYKVGGSLQARAKGLSVKLPSSQEQLTDYASYTDLTEYVAALEGYWSFLVPDTNPPSFSNESVDWGTGTYYADVAGDDIASLYTTVWYYDPVSGNPMLLGMDTPDGFDGTTLSYGLPDSWITLDGNFVSVFVLEEDGDNYLLDMPVLLNGEQMDILAWLDTGAGEYQILGAWPGFNGQMAAREILPIKSGDVIAPNFGVLNSTTGDWEYVLGDTFTVSGTPELGITPLPLGDYGVAFYAEDFAGNGAVSNLLIGQYSLARGSRSASRMPPLSGAAKEGLLKLVSQKRGTKVN
ncbi:hypothetical protein EPN96_00915 [bacterium]|nr:MAG: hypothetical protein EPN96_00915 [bacterium]